MDGSIDWGDATHCCDVEPLAGLADDPKYGGCIEGAVDESQLTEHDIFDRFKGSLHDQRGLEVEVAFQRDAGHFPGVIFFTLKIEFVLLE